MPMTDINKRIHEEMLFRIMQETPCTFDVARSILDGMPYGRKARLKRLIKKELGLWRKAE